MDTREERGQAIADAGKVRRKNDLWIVPSQSGLGGSYIVEPEGKKPSCTCLDFETRGVKCKHLFAVEYTIERETNANGETTTTETVRVTYRQEWTAYNAAQIEEKERVAALLHGLCSAIDNPIHTTGRPRLPLADTTFAAVMKVYGGMSTRRTSSDMREYAAKGYIDKAPHFNSISNALENPSLTGILKALIEESATPLKAVETDFAVDSSGFTTASYRRWFDAKYGREMGKAVWLKAHVFIGVKTNVVTSVHVTPSYENDSPHLVPLLEATTKRFCVEQVSADKAYIGSPNLDAIVGAGAFPLIPFKSNHVATSGSNRSPESRALWTKMHNFFTHNREEFLQHYHKRSNVETTFSMIKAKFGSRLRSKTTTAQVNEILCKVLCHNLCCLVSAFFELGIDARFWQDESVA